MKEKVLSVLLILTSLFGYLEWGQGQHLFLLQAEGEILLKLWTDPKSVLHPLILMPLLGQILLAITIFQKKPSRILVYIGMGSLSILLALMCIIGIISFNLKILCSTLPFQVLTLFTLIHFKNTPAVRK
jgi:hypothetical protein